MDLYVRNKNFEIVGIIDIATSVIWARRYNTVGDFELYLPATSGNILLLQEDRYITRTDTDSVMIIECIEITTNVEDGNYLTVTGRSLESILKRRIVWQQTNLYGKAELCIRQLITENIIEPSVTARKISNFVLGDLRGFTDTMEKQITGKNLGDSIEDICQTFGYGYKITLQDGCFVFDLYTGIDRSYNQSNLPYVVFSADYENLLNSDYKLDKTDYKNVVLVAGEGEGLERKTQSVGGLFHKGLQRREMYSDARNASTNNGEISDEDYYNQLIEDGQETLDNNQAAETFIGEVDYSKPYQYGKDYTLGDIVQVVNEYGIEATPRITEIIESEDENGEYNVIPTFEYNRGAG